MLSIIRQYGIVLKSALEETACCDCNYRQMTSSRNCKYTKQSNARALHYPLLFNMIIKTLVNTLGNSLNTRFFPCQSLCTGGGVRSTPLNISRMPIGNSSFCAEYIRLAFLERFADSAWPDTAYIYMDLLTLFFWIVVNPLLLWNRPLSRIGHTVLLAPQNVVAPGNKSCTYCKRRGRGHGT